MNNPPMYNVHVTTTNLHWLDRPRQNEYWFGVTLSASWDGSDDKPDVDALALWRQGFQDVQFRLWVRTGGGKPQTVEPLLKPLLNDVTKLREVRAEAVPHIDRSFDAILMTIEPVIERHGKKPPNTWGQVLGHAGTTEQYEEQDKQQAELDKVLQWRLPGYLATLATLPAPIARALGLSYIIQVELSDPLAPNSEVLFAPDFSGCSSAGAPWNTWAPQAAPLEESKELPGAFTVIYDPPQGAPAQPPRGGMLSPAVIQEVSATSEISHAMYVNPNTAASAGALDELRLACSELNTRSLIINAIRESTATFRSSVELPHLVRMFLAAVLDSVKMFGANKGADGQSLLRFTVEALWPELDATQREAKRAEAEQELTETYKELRQDIIDHNGALLRSAISDVIRTSDSTPTTLDVLDPNKNRGWDEARDLAAELSVVMQFLDPASSLENDPNGTRRQEPFLALILRAWKSRDDWCTLWLGQSKIDVLVPIWRKASVQTLMQSATLAQPFSSTETHWQHLLHALAAGAGTRPQAVATAFEEVFSALATDAWSSASTAQPPAALPGPFTDAIRRTSRLTAERVARRDGDQVLHPTRGNPATTVSHPLVFPILTPHPSNKPGTDPNEGDPWSSRLAGFGLLIRDKTSPVWKCPSVSGLCIGQLKQGYRSEVIANIIAPSRFAVVDGARRAIFEYDEMPLGVPDHDLGDVEKESPFSDPTDASGGTTAEEIVGGLGWFHYRMPAKISDCPTVPNIAQLTPLRFGATYHAAAFAVDVSGALPEALAESRLAPTTLVTELPDSATQNVPRLERKCLRTVPLGACSLVGSSDRPAEKESKSRSDLLRPIPENVAPLMDEFPDVQVIQVSECKRYFFDLFVAAGSIVALPADLRIEIPGIRLAHGVTSATLNVRVYGVGLNPSDVPISAQATYTLKNTSADHAQLALSISNGSRARLYTVLSRSNTAEPGKQFNFNTPPAADTVARWWIEITASEGEIAIQSPEAVQGAARTPAFRRQRSVLLYPRSEKQPDKKTNSITLKLAIPRVDFATWSRWARAKDDSLSCQKYYANVLRHKFASGPNQSKSLPDPAVRRLYIQATRFWSVSENGVRAPGLESLTKDTVFIDVNPLRELEDAGDTVNPFETSIERELTIERSSDAREVSVELINDRQWRVTLPPWWIGEIRVTTCAKKETEKLFGLTFPDTSTPKYIMGGSWSVVVETTPANETQLQKFWGKDRSLDAFACMTATFANDEVRAGCQVPQRLRDRLALISRVDVCLWRWRWNGVPARPGQRFPAKDVAAFQAWSQALRIVQPTAPDPDWTPPKVDSLAAWERDFFPPRLVDVDNSRPGLWTRGVIRYGESESTIARESLADTSMGTYWRAAGIFYCRYTTDVLGFLIAPIVAHAESDLSVPPAYEPASEPAKPQSSGPLQLRHSKYWLPLYVPPRLDAPTLDLPKVKLIIPLISPIDANAWKPGASDDAERAAVMVVMDEVWYQRAGPAEILEAEIELANRRYDSRPEVGFDPLSSSRVFSSKSIGQPLEIIGPVGQTFDQSGFTEQGVYASSFLLQFSPPLDNVTGESNSPSNAMKDRLESWYFAKVRLRRSLQHEGDSQPSMQSDPTPGLWTQFLPNFAQELPGLELGNAHMETSKSNAIIRFDQGAPTIDAADKRQYAVWALLTSQVPSAWGTTVETFVGVGKVIANRPEATATATVRMREGRLSSLQLRLLTIQISSLNKPSESAADSGLDALAEILTGRPIGDDKPWRECKGRIVGVTHPHAIKATSRVTK